MLTLPLSKLAFRVRLRTMTIAVGFCTTAHLYNSLLSMFSACFGCPLRHRCSLNVIRMTLLASTVNVHETREGEIYPKETPGYLRGSREDLFVDHGTSQDQA
jgi:hypothetical protein